MATLTMCIEEALINKLGEFDMKASYNNMSNSLPSDYIPYASANDPDGTARGPFRMYTFKWGQSTSYFDNATLEFAFSKLTEGYATKEEFFQHFKAWRNVKGLGWMTPQQDSNWYPTGGEFNLYRGTLSNMWEQPYSEVINTSAGSNASMGMWYFILDDDSAPEMVTITENLTGCYPLSSNPENLYMGDEFTLQYATSAGYENLVITSNIGTVSYSSDGRTATVTGTVTGDIVITGTATLIPVYYTLTNDLISATPDPNNTPSPMLDGTKYTLIYYADTNYAITYCTCTDSSAEIVYDDEDYKTKATITGTAHEDFTVIITATYRPRTFNITITGTFENCTCNYSDGETLDEEKPITITATTGYEFQEEYTLALSRPNGLTDTGTFEKNIQKNVLTYDLTHNTWNIDLNDTYKAIKPVETVGGFTNLYLVNDDILEALSRVRFEEVNIENGEVIDTQGEPTIIDYGQFITSLYIMPFALPDTLKGPMSNIILGVKDSNVQANLLTTYKYEFDLGSILVPQLYNNAYDFINTTCTIRLPYFNPVSLATEYVVGQTLGIKYFFDFYSGNATVNITSTFTNNVVYSETRSIVLQIPFIQKQNNSLVNTLSNLYKNVTDTAKVEVVRNIPYYPSDNTFGHETKKCVTIGMERGYIEVDQVELIGKATNDEKDKIKDILNQGVFINIIDPPDDKLRYYLIYN